MIYGMWYGGTGSYSYPYVDDDVERFVSRDSAVEALRSRREHGEHRPQAFEHVNRETDEVYLPDVGDDSTMTLWFSDPTGDPDPYPDEVIVYSDLD